MFFRSSARMILNRSSGAALSDDAEVSQIGRIVGRIAAIAALVISPVATAGAAGAGAPEARDLCLEGERRMEAGDLLDRTEIDHGPIAAAVAFVILLGLMLMYLATAGK